MPTKTASLPKHGVTGLLVSEEETDLFLDYQNPQKYTPRARREKKKESGMLRSVISTKKRHVCIGSLIKSLFQLTNTSNTT